MEENTHECTKKEIKVSSNCTKRKENAVSIELYDDKVIGVDVKGKIYEWSFCDLASVSVKKASYFSNNDYAIIFLLSHENNYPGNLGRIKYLLDTNLGISFCSDLYSYAPANAFAAEVAGEIDTLLKEYQSNNNANLQTSEPKAVDKIMDSAVRMLIDVQKQEDSNALTSNKFSAIDEILKYKNLSDEGIITKEEFDIKKQQLLDLIP